MDIVPTARNISRRFVLGLGDEACCGDGIFAVGA